MHPRLLTCESTSVNITLQVENGSIRFLDLWAIFKPDELVLRTDRDYKCLLKLEKTVYEEDLKCGRRFEVHCTCTINDGTGLFRRSEVIALSERKLFGGDTPAKIISLPVHPLAYSGEDRDQLSKDSIDRGRAVESLHGKHTMHYSGICEYQKLPPRAFFDPRMGDYETVWLGYTETGRVVIDAKTYLEDYPIEAGNLSRSWSNEYRAWADTTFGSFESANRALCVPFVHGYSLKKKQFCKFYVEQLERIQWDTKAIESLAIPGTQKSVLEALVTSHVYSDNPRELQGQKGKGLVVLLHGEFSFPASFSLFHHRLSSACLCSLKRYRHVIRLPAQLAAAMCCCEADATSAEQVCSYYLPPAGRSRSRGVHPCF